MSTWGIDSIRAAYLQGEKDGASHMIVAFDTFDHSNYPIYVMPGENPREKVPTNGDLVDECYRYSLGWAKQALERRAKHWEYMCTECHRKDGSGHKMDCSVGRREKR